MNSDLLTILQAVDAQRMKPAEAAEKIEAMYSEPKEKQGTKGYLPDSKIKPDCIHFSTKTGVFYTCKKRDRLLSHFCTCAFCEDYEVQCQNDTHVSE